MAEIGRAITEMSDQESVDGRRGVVGNFGPRTPIYPEVVSLGLNCEVKQMISEWRQKSVEENPDFNEESLLTRGNHFFDWNISNPWATINSIRASFENVFKVENLVARNETDGRLNFIDDTGSGIRFHHTFSRINDITTQDMIHKEYQEKSEKVQYLISKFNDLLRSDFPIFFIRRGNETEHELRALSIAISGHNGARRFLIMNARWEPLPRLPADLVHTVEQFHLPGRTWNDMIAWRPIFDRIEAIHKSDWRDLP